MKKVIFLFALILGASLYSEAQIKPHAIGIRFGSNGNLSGGELSYQHGMGGANRIEFDLGFSGNSDNNHTFLAAMYHWHWNIDGGLNWYVGPGAGIGFHEHSNKDEDDHVNLSIGGQIGLEYDFNKHGAPLNLSLDARPMWDLLGDDHGLGWGAALGIRYTW